MTRESLKWFGVRCVFHHSTANAYEERITLWRASDISDAISRAEAEANDYATILDGVSFTGMIQAYAMDDSPGEGCEVFSLIRDSDLAHDEYVDRFFDTGEERQQVVD
jgi:pentatricopeptide repeat protein